MVVSLEMARNKVTTRYQKVHRRPKKKHPKQHWSDEILLPSGLSPLARYVEENMADDLDPIELIRQFQEYDCEHSWIELSVAPDYIVDSCEICRLLKRKNRNR